ncbi:hypothetical protein BGZ79_005024 [Entomortierella chlamydospora]|nr:hypothetical protein BGZ79_005024 [Entomortierella chlamydospora]
MSIDTEFGKIQDTPLAALHQSEVSESIVQGTAEADVVPGNQDGRKRMSRPATSSLLKRLTEIPPPLLPEPPRSKTILPATQPVLSTFFHPINPSSRNSQGENLQRPNQRRRASVPDASHQDTGPSGILLSLNMASSSVQPSIAAAGGVSGHRMHSLDSTARQSHNRDSKGNNALYIGDHEQQNQRSQDISQSASSKISKLQMTRSMTRSNSVPPLGNTRDEKDIDIVEFIPSSLEKVPNTQMDEESHDSRIPTNSYSPVVSSSLDGSLPRGREIVSNSMDQSWSQASSPTNSAKRDVSSMTASQDRKKRSKRKKLGRSSSSGTVAESPEPSSLISSTALFEANMADIERLREWDLITDSGAIDFDDAIEDMESTCALDPILRNTLMSDSSDPNIPTDSENTEVLEDSSKNILLGIIAQLGKTTDLHRVTLPTFVLEPRSMLERITDFMAHPEQIIKVYQIQDPVERFIAVTRYYLSGWHIKPKGVKKPYNPIIGEIFRARWKFEDGTESFYVAEQVSHHPPISAFYYASPENNLTIVGDLKPKSRFLGNSAATLMQGEIKISFANLPGEEYFITMPNIFARGIIIGTMLLELGDSAYVRCPKNDLVCHIEFKVKGFFTGSYNIIHGKIKRESAGEHLYDISGKWSDEIYIKKHNAKEKDVLFDVKASRIHPKIVAPEEQQEPIESRRLWSKLTAALKVNDQDVATQEKNKVEDEQRAKSKSREDQGLPHVPRFFEPKEEGFDIKLKNISPDAQEAKKQIADFIFNTPTSV